MKGHTKKEIMEFSRDSKRWSKVFGMPITDKKAEELNDATKEGMRLVFVTPGAKTIFERKEEWDICCVLDACRYDIFEQVNWLKGDLSLAISCGYNTAFWARYNITGPQRDTIFVSSNPWITKTIGFEEMIDWFFHIERLWRTRWNEFYSTVLPNVVTQAGIRLHNEFPDKKLVLFYLQPHDPFIACPDLTLREDEGLRWTEEYSDPSRRSIEEMFLAYKDNLRFVLKSVERLKRNIKGKRIVITSDHGEGFGECGIAWGHAGGYVPWLVKVPWFRMEV